MTVADVRFRPVGCPKHASMQHVEAGSRLERSVDRDAVEQCTRMEPVREATWTHSETATGMGATSTTFLMGMQRASWADARLILGS